ncbi:DNA polymerase III subunit chi [Candidatus Arsenophonus lipoptenae]|uniref:DNA polymerase III subunit chi n=1 Tax=Candidatus Arsenophonus lipoptenae TaxID=634113 RepID=A0A0X8CYG4_9GAMM|nr:DNA polymerase III subunit chi [Candidatus Arsenophonus lipoptenae]AMA65187.1 DNA polymerase III subunit chi [Candidatus Arsenophonus lipoptenae]
MKKVTFYLISNLSLQKKLEIHELLACQLACKLWRINKRILIACENKSQAEKLDKMLWEINPDQFIPHNLTGEGPIYGAPIELCWPTKSSNHMRDILINLQSTFIQFSTVFNEILDFVPIDEHLKQLARERYKIYRNMGYDLIIAKQPVKSIDN